jgi:hypothetical protein
VTSLCPIKYATRLQLHNTTLFASKVHGTKRMFLRTFWWNFKRIRMTSSCSLMLPQDHSCFHHVCLSQKKERNNKNVLKKCQTAVNKWPPNFYSLHSRVNLFSLQIGNSRTFWRTFCMNKSHIFLILAHQVTKT